MESFWYGLYRDATHPRSAFLLISLKGATGVPYFLDFTSLDRASSRPPSLNIFPPNQQSQLGLDREDVVARFF